MKGGKWVALLALTLGLAGCRQAKTLTVQPASTVAGGTSVMIGGTAKGYAYVRYSSPEVKGTVKVAAGRFTIRLPQAVVARTLRLVAGSQIKQVKVPAATALGPYRAVATSYNQALWGTYLSQDERAKLTAAAKAAKLKTTRSAAQQAAFDRDQAAASAIAAAAKKAAKSHQLPTAVTGQKVVTATAGGKVTASVDDGQLLSLTTVVKLNTLETSMGTGAFGTQLGLLTTAVGAKSSAVSAGLAAAAKAHAANQSPKPIVSNGVTVSFAYGKATLTVYMSRG
ncbi:hypothetical protein [Lacticaseibacillus parakribbianus]|uniref:hypothetical protein n=1 Tax=Lacticaseibacillus parakribbianus TaxID=2970927 RepID=UPI0021CB61D8|nr:hypothetical protein [Lacticaseibacillus parakribbianus]